MRYIGKKLKEKEYEERRTSYGLIVNESGEIAVAYIEKYDMYNLIGGKIEKDESSKQALIRETKEEIGYSLDDVEYIDNLGCYYYFDIMDKYELGIMDFFKAKLGKKICEPIEEDHKLVWIKPEKIVDKMYFEYHRYILNRYLKYFSGLNKYEGKNLKIYFKSEDKEVLNDIENAVKSGYNSVVEYLGLSNYSKDIIIYVYSNVEEFHLDVFGEKKEEWLVSDADNNVLKIVSPANSGAVHDYNTMLEIISKSVADVVVCDNFKELPRWLDITTYITGLSIESSTNSKPRIKRFEDKNYFNFSDCYFITKYIVEKFGKNVVLKILNNPNSYNEILGLSDEELDQRIEEYYG